MPNGDEGQDWFTEWFGKAVVGEPYEVSPEATRFEKELAEVSGKLLPIQKGLTRAILSTVQWFRELIR
jgi:hypothetical protein